MSAPHMGLNGMSQELQLFYSAVTNTHTSSCVLGCEFIIRQYNTKEKLHTCYTLSSLVLIALRSQFVCHNIYIHDKPKIVYKINACKSNQIKGSEYL